MGQQKDERDEEKTTTCRCNQIGANWFPDGLHHHVGGNDGGDERIGNNLPIESYGAYSYYLWVATEKFNDGFGKDESDYGKTLIKIVPSFTQK